MPTTRTEPMCNCERCKADRQLAECERESTGRRSQRDFLRDWLIATLRQVICLEEEVARLRRELAEAKGCGHTCHKGGGH